MGRARSFCFQVSIHPPRVGRDSKGATESTRTLGFNPPSPCGEGPKGQEIAVEGELFQSTLPVWGGTS